ncbi:MAG TPA: PTS fructose transporter subunit IIA [Thiotrichales bacterium]|nr:PTS fructose transporter subunit IIA [Thiotrichales bacterium]
MTVGLLIVTHHTVGEALLSAATGMLGLCPLKVEVVAVPNQADPDEKAAEAERCRQRLDDGDGVLILTDMYGSTPSNISARLLRNGPCAMVAGINLPMLIRVLNYPALPLEELAEKALSGGRDGILLARPEPYG